MAGLKAQKVISGDQTLVIVESPSKAKTIQKYLGPGYEVKASVGHIRDLPKSKIGFDDEFNPVYEVSKDKEKVIKELQKETKKVKGNVVLATDPDREGEAIAWHVNSVLNLGNKSNRIFFTEITKDAVNEAIKHPRPIDMSLVDAQQARRVLDRIVGYKLSPLLWTKIRYGLSAGRVQSVALRLIVDKEREREQFQSEEYWNLYIDGTKEHKGDTQISIVKSDDETKPKFKGIQFELSKINLKKAEVRDESNVNNIIENIKNKELDIIDIKKKASKKYPKPPFTTSTLQQAAINRLGFTSKRTMSAAQRLYEAGLITYMRTDSTNIALSAIDTIRGFINSSYGSRYLPQKPIFYKTSSKGAQEAHEAIRPTNISNPNAAEGLKEDEKRLYNLIWRRTISCQMSPAEFDNTQIVASIKNGSNEYEFTSNGSVELFDGYLKAYGSDFEDRIFPFDVKKEDKLYSNAIFSNQHFTEPPARYNEASLVKVLEKYGIGRPSTYASIISTILARGYVEKEGKALRPTDTGIVVNDFLVKFFPSIVDKDFTAEMENSLDNIAEGKAEWKPMIKSFYTGLVSEIDEKKETIKKEDVVILGESDEKCDECGAPMFIKLGKYGKFLTCSRFPECKGIKSLEEATNEPVTLDTEKFEGAPKAKDGSDMILKKGRYGIFWAHADYPKVKESSPLLLKEKCPECGSSLVERKGKWGKTFIGCSNYPKCKFIKGADKSKFSKKGKSKKSTKTLTKSKSAKEQKKKVSRKKAKV